MTVVCIDPDAAVNGSGTFASPFNTWASASTWVAGNDYLQKEDTEFVGTIGPLGTGGTAGSRIYVGVYDAQTGARVTGRRGAARVDATGQSFGFNITLARPYITVEGFEVFGATSANITKTASSVSEAQYCEFRHLILRDGVANGINVSGKGNKLIGCHIYGNGQDGVYAVGDDLEIAQCHVYGNGTTNSEGDCVQLLNSSNAWIHDSVLDHSESSYKQGLIINRDDGLATGGHVARCAISVAQYVAGETSALKALYVGQPGVTVERCEISGGQYGAYLIGASATLRDCKVTVTGSGPAVGVAVRESSIDVTGNTVVGGSGLAGSIGIDHSSASYTSVTVRNNAVIDWPQGIRTGATGATYSNNAFSGCDANNSNLAGAEGTAGDGDVTAALEVTDAHRLLPTSPLLGAGVHVRYGRDLDGLQRPNPPSIGAHDAATLRAVQAA